MKGKKRSYIYLAGNISRDDQTYLWREKFTRQIGGAVSSGDVVIVDPCANNFNQGIRKFGSSGEEFVKEAVRRSQKILRAKDYQLIKMCNLMVVNLFLVDPEKPMIGTIQELTWASDIFYIPVIGIIGKPEERNDLAKVYVKHPWVDECCSAKVETVEEAVKLVEDFFLDY
jgi:hypothetical protein